jgi:hypothetical protein
MPRLWAIGKPVLPLAEYPGFHRAFSDSRVDESS